MGKLNSRCTILYGLMFFHSFLYQGLTSQHKQVLVGDNLIGQGFHNDIIAFWGHYINQIVHIAVVLYLKFSHLNR